MAAHGRSAAAAAVERLSASLSRRGLDVATPFAVQRYNVAVADAGKAEWRLSDGGRGDGGSTLAVLVGNTKALWSPLCAHVVASGWDNPEQCADPVDEYVEMAVHCALEGSGRPASAAGAADVGDAAAAAASSVATDEEASGTDGGNLPPLPPVLETRFAHRINSDEFVHIQKACAVSGYAHFNPTCHLNVHAVHGPWISLRCVIVFDCEMDPLLELPPNPQNPWPEQDAALEARVKELIAMGERARWQDWLALRDLATTESARAHRFSDAQIRYHYAHDRSAFLEPS